MAILLCFADEFIESLKSCRQVIKNDETDSQVDLHLAWYLDIYSPVIISINSEKNRID